MAVKKIEGELIGLLISTVLVNPQAADWKEVVCSEDLSVEGTRNTSSRVTRCGTLKSKGIPSYSFPIAGVANATPEAGQVSADDLMSYFQNGTDLLIKLVHKDDATIYYRQGQGFLSGYTEEVPVEDVVGFSGTVEIDGNLTLVAPV